MTLIELCAGSVRDCLIAQEAGLDRIELNIAPGPGRADVNGSLSGISQGQWRDPAHHLHGPPTWRWLRL